MEQQETVETLAEIMRSVLKKEWAMQLTVVDDWPNSDRLQAILLPNVAVLYPVSEDGITFIAVECLHTQPPQRHLFTSPTEAVVAFVLEPMRIRVAQFLRAKHGFKQ